MALGLMSKKRLGFIPHKIAGIDQLKTILARAKELEGQS
jgi:hypothetical protein